ncbi:3-oxo-5-alpha-steroid 4-dehydrogenase [Aulographum hederae CBS 113979]|uniref:3-oxo-5-alpha-steroid 4-dehydrogenase n=1 Tax=Aulographum hederae CBS 113979 TaxID=1176131 RepID=A0A6G1HD09_9PEZI|nr:3-oxo-5-alpha-steroid 4-dehydrogenase [Aulographum hederae CBS 113979]
MAIIQDWLPPTRENWEFIVYLWQFFPVVTAVQWLTSFYPQGKTSITSSLNIPGKYAWALMEIPGAFVLLYIASTLPHELGIENGARGLPWGNWVMIGMFVTHYLYRALLAPLYLNPSMSPIHPIVFLAATMWQLFNGASLGGWLAGHGPTTTDDWAGRLYMAEIGMVVWAWGFLANIWHDDELREIRRAAARKMARQEKENGGETKEGNGGVEKVYMLPKNGLFHWVLYAHYLCEWIEWCGFWMVAGWDCVPARLFVMNEIATMLPRALAGRNWYVEKFGKEKVGSRKAVIPGLL